MKHLNRRHFLGAGLLLGASTLLGNPYLINQSPFPKNTNPHYRVSREKPMVTISDRPPLLKSARGRDIYTQAITPNDEFLSAGIFPIFQVILI